MYFNVRLDDARQCILVIIGVTEDGVKEFVAIEDGYRESEQAWFMVLSDLRQRGLEIGPELAVGDGALGLSAEKHWIRLRGFKRLTQVIRGVKFADGTPIVKNQEQVEDGLISRSAA